MVLVVATDGKTVGAVEMLRCTGVVIVEIAGNAVEDVFCKKVVVVVTGVVPENVCG